MGNATIIQQQIELFNTKPYSKKSNLLKGWRLKDFGHIKKHLTAIEEEMQPWLKSRQESSRKARETAFNLILPNLVASAFTREPVAIAAKSSFYGKDSYLSKYHLKEDPTKEVINGLLETGYMKRLSTGSNLTKRSNQYVAGDRLTPLLSQFLYAVERDFSEDLIKVNRPKKMEADANGKEHKVTDKSFPTIQFRVSNDDVYISTKGGSSDPQIITHADGQITQIIALPADHPDLVRLKKINDFLQGCTYALKGPVQLVYSNNKVTEGGRLYCDLQNLPNRRAKIRLNTLLNGNPVAEVDLKCNHPAMLMGLAGEQISTDFYSKLAQKTGISRNTIKGLMTRFIGASDRRISLKEQEWLDEGYEIYEIPNHHDKNQLISVLEHDYPSIFKGCFKGMGVFLQNLEGQILLDAMCALIDSNNIPSLPIHDCLFVEAHRVDEAKMALKFAWRKHLDVDFFPHMVVKTANV